MLETILILFILWNLWPFFVLNNVLRLPDDISYDATKSLLGAMVKGWLCFLPDILAPIVVPFALIQTTERSDKLPNWASWWDNDVSINGDRPEYWDLEYTGDCYYAPGHHPRSFWARYVWLGWRNRASKLAQQLGHTWQPGEKEDNQTWGDPKTGRDHEGWAVNRKGDVYQLYVVKKIGPLCYRLNWGHKVWPLEGDDRPIANVVNISFSLLKYKGE